MKFAFIASLLALLCLNPEAMASGYSQSYMEGLGLTPYTDYQTFETEHFELVYQKGYFAFAERAATHLEHAHQVLSPLLKWQPRAKTVVLITDNDDSANGASIAALRIGIVLIATPPEAWYSTSYTDDWIKLLVFHEYVHTLNIDPTTGWMEILRIFFGDVVRPNGLWPRWMLEGLAVYFETRTSKLGRGRSPYFDGVLRAFLEEQKLGTPGKTSITLDRMNGEFPGFPGGEIAYLFGYEMWNQMAKGYPDTNKADSDMGEISLRSASRMPYFISGNQKNVTGKAWDQLWDEFIADSNARLAPQIEQVKKGGETPFEIFSDSDYSALGGALSPDSKWLAYTKVSTKRRTGFYLQNLETRKEIRVDDKVQGVGIAFTPDSKKIIFSSHEKFNTFQNFSDLFLYDIAEDSITRLSHGLRAKDPTLSPDGKQIVFLKAQKGTHTLWLTSLEDLHGKSKIGKPRIIYEPKNFTILGTPKFFGSDQIVFSELITGSTESNLRVLNFKTNEVRTLFQDGYINRSIAVHQNDVYFVSNKNGIDNLYLLKNGTTQAVPVTNVTTGTLFPFLSSKGDLWASRLSASGYQVGRFVNKTPLTQSQLPNVVPNAPQEIPEALTEPKDQQIKESDTKNYSAWSSLAPRQWGLNPVGFPGFIGYSSTGGLWLGASVLGIDSTGKHEYDGNLYYHFKVNKVDPSVSYTYYGFRPAITLSASSNTFDIAADTLGLYYKHEYRASLAFSFPVRWTFTSLNPTLYFFNKWAGKYDIASDSRVADPDPNYNRAQIPGVGASVGFASLEQSKFGFMPERGQEFLIAGEGQQYDKQYALWKYLLSYTHYIPVGEHSVLKPRTRWLDTTRRNGLDSFDALAEGKRSDDFTDRAMGSSLKRLGIRGYLEDRAIKTGGISTTSLDFHFPIDRIFAGPGTFPFFVQQAHAFVFTEMSYIPSAIFRNLFLPSFGGGISFDTTALLYVPLRFNFEMQNGTRKDFGGEQLFFVSIESSGLF